MADRIVKIVEIKIFLILHNFSTTIYKYLAHCFVERSIAFICQCLVISYQALYGQRN